MCEPVTIAMAATALIGAGVAVYQGNQAQKALNEQAAVQQTEINNQAQQRTFDRMEEVRALRASSRAAAAEAGVAGNSVDIMLNDITAQGGRDVALIEANRKSGISASDAEAAARRRNINAEVVGGVVNSGAGFANSYSQYKIGTD